MWTAVPPANAASGEPAGTGDGAVSGLVAEVEDPVRDREVDDRDPDGHEDAPGEELRAVRDGTADQRGRDDREHQLEAGEREQRDPVGTAVVRELVDRGAETRLGDVADEPAARVGERQREAVDHPQHADDADRRERHQHHVERASGLGHSSVEERETGGHEEHEGRARQHPGCVARVQIH